VLVIVRPAAGAQHGRRAAGRSLAIIGFARDSVKDPGALVELSGLPAPRGSMPARWETRQ